VLLPMVERRFAAMLGEHLPWFIRVTHSGVEIAALRHADLCKVGRGAPHFLFNIGEEIAPVLVIPVDGTEDATSDEFVVVTWQCATAESLS
jgi:hypothetical protein